jgi:LysR family glycine cleavage system transcriptional activator
MSSRWLPPLTALKTFEAVGRVGMTRAAMELNVTSAAISHQIRVLEADLGVKLFSRTQKGLILNKSGREYLNEVAASFELLYGATRRIKNPFRAHRLVIECLTSFANDFLIPRLGAFYRANPDIELEFRTLQRPRAKVDLAHIGAHMAITGGNVAGEWPGLNAERLAHEVFFPVCAPSLLENAPLTCPADLARHTLLVVTGAPEGWSEWLAAARDAGEDVGGLTLGDALRFDTFHSASLAARQGIGVDLGRSPLVSTALARGELVEPFSIRVRSTAAYWLVFGDAVAEAPAFQRFRAWLMSELEVAGAV